LSGRWLGALAKGMAWAGLLYNLQSPPPNPPEAWQKKETPSGSSLGLSFSFVL
jgi:hypothetical protein